MFHHAQPLKSIHFYNKFLDFHKKSIFYCKYVLIMNKYVLFLCDYEVYYKSYCILLNKNINYILPCINALLIFYYINDFLGEQLLMNIFANNFLIDLLNHNHIYIDDLSLKFHKYVHFVHEQLLNNKILYIFLSDYNNYIFLYKNVFQHHIYVYHHHDQ